MSRSCRAPQDGQVHSLVLRLSSASRCPHASQVLDDGYFTVEALTRRQPYPDAEVATERAYLLARAR